MQAKRRRRPRHVRIDHAGLDHRKAVLRIDLQNLAHACHFDDHSVIQRQGAARQSCARPTRCERNASSGEHLHDCGCLFGRSWEDHRARAVLVLRQAVALVDKKFVRVCKYCVVAQDRAEIFYEFVQSFLAGNSIASDGAMIHYAANPTEQIV